MNTPTVRSFLDFIGRVITVGVAYTATLIVAGSGLAAVSQIEINGDGLPLLFWTFMGSLIMALALGLAAATITASRPRHLVIWTTLLFGNIAAAIIRQAILAPETANAVPLLLIQQFLACVVMADAVYYFFAPVKITSPQRAHHHWAGWLGRFAAASLASVIFTFAFGAINFSLLTQPYYPGHLNGLSMPEPQTLLLAELVRAPIVVLSLLPLLLTVHTTSNRLLVMSGLLLFVIGGITPLLWQVNHLPLVLLMACGLELFAQNVATGAAAAWLLGSYDIIHHYPTPRLKSA